MLLLAKNLPTDKFIVTVACACSKKLNLWCQKFLDAEINILRLKVWHKHDPRHFLYLRKILPEFDLFHMHIWNPASGRFGFLAARGKPLIITEHDPFPLTGMKGWVKKKLLPGAKKIIVASLAAKKLVEAQEPGVGEKITVVPNGIDVEGFQQQTELIDRHEFRKKYLGASPMDRVIVCVAELHERKGQKYLIEAMRTVVAAMPNVKLVLVGEGGERHTYERLSKPLGTNIVFAGHQKNVGQFMAAADVFALPSVREAFGLVLLEAAVAGIPVIATRVGGIPEIVIDGETGILVPPEDPSSLASALLDVLRNPEEVVRMTRQAKLRVNHLYTAKEMAEKTAAVYDAVS